MTERVPIPRGFTKKSLAITFAAYLTAGRLGQHHGPFTKNDGSEDDWQLDGSNDYFLHIEGSMFYLSCRYGGKQERIIDAMLNLFKVMCLE